MPRLRKHARTVMPVFITLGGLAIYLRTLAPSVATIFDDSLEFQVVCPTLRIAHPPGYPLYTLLGWLFSHLPVGDPAYRVNLLSAVAASLTLACLYLLACEVTDSHLPALAAPVALGLSPVFWSQATIAEVYTLHTLFITAALYFMLKAAKSRPRFLLPAAFIIGTGLAHHRTSVFLLVPLGWIVISTRKKGEKVLLPTLGLLLIPALAYAYIPLRGMYTTSLDETYRNTFNGFLNWVTASAYGVFLHDNPLAGSRPLTFYARMWWEQFGPLGLLAGLVGMGRMVRRDSRNVLWWLAFTPFTAFAFIYKVPDVEVFFLPSFLLFSVAISLGLDAASRVPGQLKRILALALLLLMLGQSAFIAGHNFPSLDRSDDWEVYELGSDWLASIPEKQAVVVGILGETTLMRYFQELYGLRPDVLLVAANSEEERLTAVNAALSAGKPVYLTRPLPPLPAEAPLWAVGNLIRVWGEPPPEVRPSMRIKREIVEGLRLEGYDVAEPAPFPIWPGRTLWMPHPPYHLHRIRVVLHWRALEPLKEELKFSIRLYNLQGKMVQQQDKIPVHFAYPVTRWPPRIAILDVYDFRVPPGQYELVVIAYDPITGAEKGRIKAGLVEVP